MEGVEVRPGEQELFKNKAPRAVLRGEGQRQAVTGLGLSSRGAGAMSRALGGWRVPLGHRGMALSPTVAA